jgi:hypothetical protein
MVARPLAACRPLHRGRDACDRCGWIRDERRPAERIPEPTFRERLADERGVFVAALREQRGVVLGLLDVLGFYMALRAQDASALRALERVMDALVTFDARCEAGDVAGAAAELRGFLRPFLRPAGGHAERRPAALSATSEDGPR